ncbi:hypothetical protein DIPPA_20072 [Diplonema papillatum]|nr:hypothetical protein DIPPA_20072 [Diplonema papillatum]
MAAPDCLLPTIEMPEAGAEADGKGRGGRWRSLRQSLADKVQQQQDPAAREAPTDASAAAAVRTERTVANRSCFRKPDPKQHTDAKGRVVRPPPEQMTLRAPRRPPAGCTEARQPTGSQNEPVPALQIEVIDDPTVLSPGGQYDSDPQVKASMLEARLRLFHAAWELFVVLHSPDTEDEPFTFTLKHGATTAWEVTSDDLSEFGVRALASGAPQRRRQPRGSGQRQSGSAGAYCAQPPAAAAEAFGTARVNSVFSTAPLLSARNASGTQTHLARQVAGGARQALFAQACPPTTSDFFAARVNALFNASSNLLSARPSNASGAAPPARQPAGDLRQVRQALLAQSGSPVLLGRGAAGAVSGPFEGDSMPAYLDKHFSCSCTCSYAPMQSRPDAFRRALRHMEAREKKVQEDLVRIEEHVSKYQYGGSEYQAVVAEKEALKAELRKRLKKVNDLAKLTDRCGQRMQDTESLVESLRKRSARVQALYDKDKKRYNEAIRLADNLLIDIDALQMLADERQTKITALTASQTQLEDRIKLLEAERKLLLTAGGMRLEDMMKELYSSYLKYTASTKDRRPHDVRQYFKGLGINRNVPVYLRHQGRVNNLCLGKGVLEKLIREMWVSRYILEVHDPAENCEDLTSDGVVGGNAASLALKCARRDPTMDHVDYANTLHFAFPRCPFVEFFHKYINKRWANPIEWAYSLVDAMVRFRYDADVEMFYEILQGRLPEDVFLDQHVMIHKFRRVLTMLEPPEELLNSWKKHDASMEMCYLPAGMILDAVRVFFPAKSTENIDALACALYDDVYTLQSVENVSAVTPVMFLELFSEDADGDQMMFLELLRDQHLEEIALFMSAIVDMLDNFNKSGGEPWVTYEDIRRKMLFLDPHRPEEDIFEWFCLLTGGAHDELSPSDKRYAIDTLIRAAPHILQKKYTSRDVRF